MFMPIFSGSYAIDDVHILLKPIEIKNTPIVEKEQLIQSGNYHYSEMITYESLPSDAYLMLFQQIFLQNRLRLASDLITLALKISQHKQGEITLISLARAGTPIGVLLKRILQQRFNRVCHHYSISIIRDKGIDTNALQYIIQHHSNLDSFTFIDGWTGKGVIAEELNKSILKFNHKNQTEISPDLYVLNDIAGVAAVTASFDDYLVPSSLLNSTVSGLISRSILNQNYLKKDDFHGCIYYQAFLEADLSQWFVDKTMFAVDEIIDVTKKQVNFQSDRHSKQKVQQQSINFIKKIKFNYNINNVNLIKPGIGEATRVLLRRAPDLLILKDITTNQTLHLVLLAKEKGVKVIEDSMMPYQAVSIIKEINHG
jgi:hypothetical protein